MKSVALVKAREHLELAKGAAKRLILDGGVRPFEQAWSEYLSQVSRFYSKMEQGAKGGRESEPWFGRRKRERKDDPLLSYVHHARNVDEHGLDHITLRRAQSLTFGFPETDEATVSFEMMVDGNGQMHVRNPRVASPKGGIDSVEIANPSVGLVGVRDRGVGYEPPTIHLGKPIVDRSP